MLDSGLHQQAVDNNFDRVIFPLIELNFIFEIHQLAIHTRARVAVLGQLLHFFFKFTFATADNRR